MATHLLGSGTPLGRAPQDAGFIATPRPTVTAVVSHARATPYGAPRTASTRLSAAPGDTCSDLRWPSVAGSTCAGPPRWGGATWQAPAAPGHRSDDPLASADGGSVARGRHARNHRQVPGRQHAAAAPGTMAWTALGLRLGMLSTSSPPQREHTWWAISARTSSTRPRRPRTWWPPWSAPRHHRRGAARPASCSPASAPSTPAESLFLTGTHPWAPRLARSRGAGRDHQAGPDAHAGQPAHAVQSTTGSGPGQPAAMSMAGWRCRAAGAARPVRVSGSSGSGPPSTQERAIFYCPTCQGGLAPDRGEPQRPLGSSPRRGVRQPTRTTPDVPLTGRPSRRRRRPRPQPRAGETSLSTADSGTSRASQIAASSSEDASFSPRSTSLEIAEGTAARWGPRAVRP